MPAEQYARIYLTSQVSNQTIHPQHLCSWHDPAGITPIRPERDQSPKGYGSAASVTRVDRDPPPLQPSVSLHRMRQRAEKPSKKSNPETRSKLSSIIIRVSLFGHFARVVEHGFDAFIFERFLSLHVSTQPGRPEKGVGVHSSKLCIWRRGPRIHSMRCYRVGILLVTGG